MRTFVLSLALLVSAICVAQVPSVTVENAKGEAFNTKTLLQEGTPMINLILVNFLQALHP